MNAVAEKRYSSPVEKFSTGGGEGILLPAQILAGPRREQNPYTATIIFIPLSDQADKIETDWARNSENVLLRRCPVCKRDSIIGHGRRRKQAHDGYHDWIGVRRGFCQLCGRTFTFLPLLSLPYSHYSLLARAQALRRRFIEHCPWEKAAPTMKDPDRMPDPSTLRRWSSGLDRLQPADSFRGRTFAYLAHWLRHSAEHQAEILSGLTMILQVLWPLRL